MKGKLVNIYTNPHSDYYLGDDLNLHIEKLREQLDREEIVGLDGFFAPSDLMALRMQLIQFSKVTPPKEHGKPLQEISSSENFYRIDDDPSKSIAPHLYQTFVFGNLSKFRGRLGQSARAIFEKMLRIQNAIAGTEAKLEIPYKEKYWLRPQIIRYPRGGGYLSEHVHSYEPQRVGLILNLSDSGVDFQEGATFFRPKSGDLVSDPSFGALGRVIVFKYDMSHGVWPVDPSENIDWKSADGKWSAVLPLY